MKHRKPWITTIVIALAFASLWGLFWIGWNAFVPFNPANKTATIIEVHKGEKPAKLAETLFDAGLVESTKKFLFIGRVFNKIGKIKVGEYELSPAMNLIEILGTLSSGKSLGHPLTVREGENIYEIASDFELSGRGLKEEFIQLCKDKTFIASLGFKPPLPPSLEGYLFPETYLFTKSSSGREIIRQMVKKFQMTWSAEHTSQAQARGMTLHQVVTLASIIEKETGAPQERPLISSVFHNRLKKRMRLQSDPTTIYGIWEQYKGNLRREDLARISPYNTYAISGLPLGPISNPGLHSLNAALNPANTDYLFFVSHNDGTHEFTTNLQAHSEAVRQFQKNRKAREGKSWRDLYSKQKTGR